MTTKCIVCSVPCETSCGNCKKVWYCCVDHQKGHRQEHKEECFPAIERENEKMGHYFVATRNIKPLEVIWTEKPIMICPDALLELPNRLPMCLGCCVILPGTFDGGFPNCDSCKWPLCSPSCEDIDWHSQFECELFQRENVKPLDFHQNDMFYEGVKLVRIFLLKRSNSVKWSKINSLRTDLNWLRSSVGGVFPKISKYLVDFIRNRCKLNEEPQLIDEIYGIINRNSHRKCLDNTIAPGRKFSTVMNERKGKMLHSCLRNTVSIISHDRTKTLTYATSEIKAGEKLCDFFLFGDMQMELPGHVERRSMLFVSHRFYCTCALCLDPTEMGTFYSAVKCNKKTDGKSCPGYYLPCVVANPTSVCDFIYGNWQCNFPECKNEEKYSALRKIVDPIQGVVDAMVPTTSLIEKLLLIKEHENITLHENHFLLMKLRFSVLPNLLWNVAKLCEEPSLNTAQRLTGAVKLKAFADKCLEIADKIQPGFTLLRGVILYFIYAENYMRVKYNLPNAQPTEEMQKVRDEASSILKLLTKGTYGNGLYNQLVQNEISTDKIYINGFIE